MPEPLSPPTLLETAFYVGTVENLYWGNQTRDRPKEVPSILTFTAITAVVKIDWQDPFTGLFKINQDGLNYCRYKGVFYFMEPVKFFGGNWYLYRLVYDVWVNEVLIKGVEVVGTLSKTSNVELVMQNIEHTVPLLQSSNKVAYYGVEVTSEKTPPTLNFKISKYLPKWDHYLDATAFETKFKSIFQERQVKAHGGGFEEGEQLKLEAVQYTSYKWKWYIPLLRDVAKYFRRHQNKLKVYELHGQSNSTAHTLEAVFNTHANKVGIKRGLENKYFVIGPDIDHFLGTTVVSVREVESIDFSGLTSIDLLNLSDLEIKPIPKKDLSQLKEASVIDLGISVDQIRGFILQHKTTPQVLFDNAGKRLENKGFRIGEIKQYNELTNKGEVKGKDRENKTLEILAGIKNYDKIKNWNVETTQANFLKDHGSYKKINVKAGDIVIPLEVFNLVHEKEKDRVVQAEAEQKTEHLELFEEMDLEQVESLAALEKLANQQVLSGDQWYEQAGLSVRPWYNKKGYTIGEIKIESIDIQSEELKLSGRTKLYYMVIRPVKLKLSGGIPTPNASYLKAYSEDEFIPYVTKRRRKPLDDLTKALNGGSAYPTAWYYNIASDETFTIFQAWSWFFNSEDWWNEWGSKFPFIPKKHEIGFEGLLIEWPKNKPIPNEVNGYWEKFDYKDLSGLHYIRLKNLFNNSDHADVYRVTNPMHLLIRFVRDWTDSTKYNKFKIVNIKLDDLNQPFELIDYDTIYSHSKRSSESLWYSMIVKFYDNKPYRLIIPVKYKVNSRSSVLLGDWINHEYFNGSYIDLGWCENFLIQIVEWYRYWPLMWSYFMDGWKLRKTPAAYYSTANEYYTTYYPPNSYCSRHDAQKYLISGSTDLAKLLGFYTKVLTHRNDLVPLFNSYCYPGGNHFPALVTNKYRCKINDDASDGINCSEADDPIKYRNYMRIGGVSHTLSFSATSIYNATYYERKTNPFAYPSAPYGEAYFYGVTWGDESKTYSQYWERDLKKYSSLPRFGLWESEDKLYSVSYDAVDILNQTTNFKFKDLLLDKTLTEMPKTVAWWDKTDLEQTHSSALFDLKGTNYLLCVQKQNSGELAYMLILRDPTNSVRPSDYQSYGLYAPVNITEPAQVINQAVSLYFYGNVEPLKIRKSIVNFGSKFFKDFRVKYLPLDRVTNPYEYRLVNIITDVEHIEKIFQNPKLTVELPGSPDPAAFEKMQLDNEQARALREHNARVLENQRRAFNEQTALARERHIWQYEGEGQKIWERQQAYQALTSVGNIALSLGGAGWSLTHGNVFGALSGAMSTAGAFQYLLHGAQDQKTAREQARELERRQLEITEAVGKVGLDLAYEKHILENVEAERQERLNLVSLFSGYKVESITNQHLHKAYIKHKQVGDVHLIVNYPGEPYLGRLREYYLRNGYDVFLPNKTISRDTMNKMGPNIQFSAIDSINVANPLIRAKLTETFLNGVRLRD